MSNEYDKIIRENIEEVILPLADKILGISPVSMEEIPDDLQTTIERKPDFLKKVITESGEEFILQIEFQANDNTEMVYRMLEYRSIITRKYRLTVRQFVLYMGEGKSEMVSLIDEQNLQFNYVLKNISDYHYQALLTSDIPEEIVLAILSDFQGQHPEEVIRRILEKIIAIVPNTLKLQRYLRQLGVLSKLRNLQNDTFKLIQDMPIEFDIETDYLFQKGEIKGEIKGKQKGKQEIVTNMLSSGQLTAEQIANFTGVDLQEVIRIRDSIKNQ